MAHPVVPDLQGSPVLVGTHNLITQTMVRSLWDARPADIYGYSGVTVERNRTLIALGKLVAEVAKLCNFTPVIGTLDTIHAGNIDPSYSGFVIPFVVPKIAERYYLPLDKTGGTIFLSLYRYFNFVYCTVDKDMQQLRFQLLLEPFDMWMWAYSCLIGILVIFALWLPQFKKDMWNGLSTSIFITISGIFSTTIHDTSKKNTIILWWLVMCLILNNLYSGVLTSLLIAPVEKDVADTVDELAERKFQFVFAKVAYFRNIIAMTKAMAANSKENSSLQVLANGMVIKETIPEAMKALAFGTSTVLFGPFVLNMQYWLMLTEMVEKRFRQTRSPRDKRFCHMGRELTSAYSIPEAWIFLMNQEKGKVTSREMLVVMSNLDANGIHPYWMEFFVRIQGTKRFQDLNRFKSKAETFEEVPVEPLALYKGSVTVIFALYGVCVAICLVAFGAELCWKWGVDRL